MKCKHVDKKGYKKIEGKVYGHCAECGEWVPARIKSPIYERLWGQAMRRRKNEESN